MTNDNQTPQAITDKTKSYKFIIAFSVLFEIISYLMFLIFLALVIYLPEYLQLQLTIAEDEIGFYILDPEDVAFWILILKTGLMVLSFYPLLIGVLLRLMRKTIVGKQ